MTAPQTDPRSFHVPLDPPATESEPPAPLPASTPGRRRRWLRGIGIALALALLFPAYFAFSAWRIWEGVERVDLAGVLAGSDSGTNYLVVGTDSRDGLPDDVENAGVIFGVEGERTDTIAILRIEGDDVRLLAIPRDLWVSIDGSNERINAAFVRGGPETLVRTVQSELGIGLDHYLEVDFAGFLSLVDALGGVTVDFPHPARDDKSGLSVPTAGPHELDAAGALAYVRSRSYVEIIDGVEVRDPTADLGRVQRQQIFLSAVFAELGATRNPFTLLDALDGVAANVRVDHGLGLRTVASLGLTIRGADPETATLPTTRFITDSGADVLLLDRDAAASMLAEFA